MAAVYCSHTAAQARATSWARARTNAALSQQAARKGAKDFCDNGSTFIKGGVIKTNLVKR